MVRVIRKCHKYLGLGLGVIMIAWFISGGVMIYAPLPRNFRTPQQRIRFSRALQSRSLKLGFAQAWHIAGSPSNLREARLNEVAGRPAFIFRLQDNTYRVVWADTGRKLRGVSLALAKEAAKLALDSRAEPLYQGLVDCDQWTVGTAAPGHLGPFYKFTIPNARDTQIYISSRTGEICQVTTSSQRLWAWLGAITHWFYFAFLRRHLEIWEWTIIIISALGCLLCITGLWLGVKFLNIKGWEEGRSISPFKGLCKYHHLLGLAFGITTLTWCFSGMMSMNPLHWASPTHPPARIAALLGGAPLDPGGCTLHPLQALEVMGPDFEIRMLKLVNFQGRPYLLALDGRGNSRLLPAWQAHPAPLKALGMDRLLSAARQLIRAPIISATFLPKGDIYQPLPPRPLLRICYGDPARTWIYLDPARMEVAAVMDRSGRLNRWLYRFLHTLDLPWLLERPRLREGIMLLLLGGGLGICISGPLCWVKRRLQRMRAKKRAIS